MKTICSLLIFALSVNSELALWIGHLWQQGSGTICGMVWKDDDGNGTIDLGEPPLADWTIIAIGPDPQNNILTATTDANGNYCFMSLTPGEYVVAEGLQKGWIQTAPASGTHTVNVTAGSFIQDINFGNRKCSRQVILNTGFDEIKGSLIPTIPPGQPDDDWLVMAGPNTQAAIVVEKKSSWGDPLLDTRWISASSSATASPGSYVFQFCFCLAEGFTNAKLSLDVQSGGLGSAGVFLNDNKIGESTSDSSPTHIEHSDQTSFRSGQNCVKVVVLAKSSGTMTYVVGLNLSGTVTVDSGYCGCPGSIQGMKFNDLNGNGVKDQGEPGIQGWTIQGKDANGNLVSTAMTDAQGNYSFTNLPPATYTVSEVSQSGWTQTFPPAPGTHTVTLASGSVAENVDFGNRRSSCVLDPGLQQAQNTFARNIRLAQTFTPVATGYLEKVIHGLDLVRSNHVNSYNLLITKTTAGSPTSPPAWKPGDPTSNNPNILYFAQGVKDSASGGAVDGVHMIPVGQQPLLIAGTTYALILVPGDSGLMYWRGNSSPGSYPNGSAYEWSGNAWVVPSSGPRDHGFRLEGTCITGPLPPDLMITKSHSGNFVMGQNGVYTITVKNEGQGPTTGPITVTDSLPPGLTYVSGTGTNWTCSAGPVTSTGQTVTCTYTGAALQPNQSAPPLTLTVSVGLAPAPLSLNNCAEVKTPNDTNAANDKACDLTTIVPPLFPDLMITKSHSGNFTVGQNGVYTITVKNNGPGTTTGTITMTDTLPPGLTYVSGTGTNWSCTAGPVTSSGQTVTCTNPGPLAPNASSHITLTVSVATVAAPSVTNCAEVRTPNDSNSSNDRACDPTIVAVSRCVTPPPNMVAWWPMDETSGTTVADIVGGNNGTHFLATSPSPTPANVVPAPGKVPAEPNSGALKFGLGFANNYVQAPSSASLNFGTGDFSIDAWIMPEANQLMPIIFKGSSSGPGYLLLLTPSLVTSGLHLRVGLTGASGPAVNHSSTQTIPIGSPIGSWTHVAVTVQRGSAAGGKVYINGSLDSTFSTTGLGNLDNTAPLLIGRAIGTPNDVFYNGRIDEVEIFKRALTQPEIQSIVNAGSAGKCKTGGPPTGQPDFEPQDLLVTPPGMPGGTIPGGSLAVVTFKIRNVGTGTAGAAQHQVLLVIGRESTPLTPIPLTTGPLMAGEATLPFTVSFRAPGPFPAALNAAIRVVADWNNQVVESNETNNTKEFSIRIQ